MLGRRTGHGRPPGEIGQPRRANRRRLHLSERRRTLVGHAARGAGKATQERTAVIIPWRRRGAEPQAMANDHPVVTPRPAAWRKIESSAERLGDLVTSQRDIALLAWRNVANLATPLGAFDLWVTVARRTVEANMVLAEAMTGVGTSLLKAGIDPFHRVPSTFGRNSDAA
jgi:hypothetical protein